MIGQLVGHYRVLEKIGAGGMGEVFRARDERLGRDVALKLIRPASSDNPDHLRRFEQEARAAAALNHPNILAIYDVGFAGSTPYIVSELLQGKTLRQRLYEGPIPVRQATEYAIQIAHGLIAAHERLIVHRDLKPENLFLTEDGRVKILDFGVAKLQTPAEDDRAIQNMPTVTKAGSVIGTVAYMSPEQLRSKPVDHRSDIFSFGAILYEMLTARRAFHGETEVDTMTAVLLEQPPDADFEQAAIPTAFQNIVRHCLEKDADDRFQSAKDLAFALQTLTGSSTAGSSTGRNALLLKSKSRPSSTLLWTATGMLAAASALLLLLYLRPPAPPPSYQRLTFEMGTVYAARFAPGGSIVYGAAWSNKPTRLFSTVGTPPLTQPLNLVGANLLAVSPTNELAIVLGGTHNGQLEIVGGMLARAPMAGGSPKEVLADVRSADWNHEGQLAVVHYLGGRAQLEFPIGNKLYQTGGWISHIRFSPDGTQIAFMDHPKLWDQRGTVCSTDLSGHVHTLSQEWESEQGVAWRPDGKEIWFTAAEKGTNLNLFAVTPSGKLRTLLDLPVGIVLEDVAADGRALVSLNSKRLSMAASSPDGKEDIDLSWHDWNVAKEISRDGQSILFEDASEAAGSGYVVALEKLDGTLPTRLGDGSAGGLSPDGKWAISIAVSANRPQLTLLPTGPGESKPVDVSGLEQINNGWARFLADGSRIITNAKTPGHPNRCYLLDISGGKPVPVTPEGILCGPSSPDGQSVVGIGSKYTVSIYSLSDPAAQPRIIPGDPSGFHPLQWSADGAFLYGVYDTDQPIRVYKLSIATGQRTSMHEVHPGVPAGVVSISPVVVSRDGTRFAYSYNQTLSVLYIINGLR